MKTAHTSRRSLTYTRGGSILAARLPTDESGAVHIIEAMLSAALLIYILAFISLPQPGPAYDDDLYRTSGDIVNIFMYRSGNSAHPDFRLALSSSSGWEASKAGLDKDISGLLPEGVYYALITPYGSIGGDPPVAACTRPVLAYCEDTKGIIECRLVLWRF